jgi:hypothetical protein
MSFEILHIKRAREISKNFMIAVTGKSEKMNQE